MFAGFTRLAMFTGLTLLARFTLLAGLALVTRFAVLARLLLFALIRLVAVAVTLSALAHKGLRLLLHRNEAGLLAEIREALAVIVEIIGRRHVVDVARLRLVLTELLLGGGNQAKIVLGVLIVVLGRHGVTGRTGIARELDVFFGDMGGGATDLDIRPVRLEHPGQRVLAAPVIIIVVVVTIVVVTSAAIPVAHPLVVLTVSHVLPLFQPLLGALNVRSLELLLS
jgi:hypothetical protein